MSLRIAFDCDGVLADMDSALEEIAVRLFGPLPAPSPPPAPATTATPAQADDPGASNESASPVEPAPTPAGAAAPAPAEITPEEEQVETERIRRLSRTQQHELWDEVRKTENFWESLKEIEPGVIRRLSDVAHERRWETIFVTQRPPSGGDTTQRQTQRWLVEHGFDLPSVYVTKGSRGKVADALSLDILVDDRPENCLDVKIESRARAILIWGDALSTLPPNARRLGIEPVQSVGALIDMLTAPPPKKPGILKKLKRLIRA
ncbi:MAG TPA: hypothetical protein VGK32_02690 [Vicinamibacterales bacterium]|jgi:hypothetical protein